MKSPLPNAPSGMLVGGRPRITKGNFGWWLVTAAVVYLLATGRLMHYLHLATVPAAASTSSSSSATTGSASVTAATSSASASAGPVPVSATSGGGLQLASLPGVSTTQGSVL